MRDLVNGYMQFLGFARGIDSDRRTVEAEAFAHMARQRAMMIERHYLEQEASGDLGDARLADLDDTKAANLFDPSGWFLGVMERRFLFLNADARRLLSLRMKYLAYEAPHRLVLSELWRFVNASDGQLQAAFADMKGSPHEDVAGTAAYMLSVMLEAPKQFEAYRSECIEALGSFSPSSSLARATSENMVDFGAMKDRPITVYLCVPSSKIGVAAPWLAMILNHAIEEIAAHEGSAKVRLLVDEFAQLPAPIPAVMKALRLYRGRGILMTLYCQGRFSLQDAGYSQAAVKEIEDQAACIQMWGIEDPSLIRDVSYWSGNTSVVQVNPSHNGGQVAQGSMGRGEQKRPVLQVENIRRINDGRQIIKLPGFPLLIAERASYWQVSPWKDQVQPSPGY